MSAFEREHSRQAKAEQHQGSRVFWVTFVFFSFLSSLFPIAERSALQLLYGISEDSGWRQHSSESKTFCEPQLEKPSLSLGQMSKSCHCTYRTIEVDTSCSTFRYE